MDGLLFDTEGLYWELGDTVLRRRGYRYGVELQQRMMGRVGLSAVQQMIDFHSLGDTAEDLLAECDELFAEMIVGGVAPMPGLSDWIDTMRTAGVPFGLATSNRRRFVDVILRHVDWRPELAFELTGDDVTHGKPDPEMYLKAAAGFGIPPQQMIVLEDSQNGCASAVAAGAIAVAVPSVHTQHQCFEGAALIAASLSDPKLANLLTNTQSQPL